jgi:hypothetical protein
VNQLPHVLPDHQDQEVNLGVVLLTKATHTAEEETADQAVEHSEKPLEKANPTVEDKTVEEPPERENPTPLDHGDYAAAKANNEEDDASPATPEDPSNDTSADDSNLDISGPSTEGLTKSAIKKKKRKAAKGRGS